MTAKLHRLQTRQQSFLVLQLAWCRVTSQLPITPHALVRDLNKLTADRLVRSNRYANRFRSFAWLGSNYISVQNAFSGFCTIFPVKNGLLEFSRKDQETIRFNTVTTGSDFQFLTLYD